MTGPSRHSPWSSQTFVYPPFLVKKQKPDNTRKNKNNPCQPKSSWLDSISSIGMWLRLVERCVRDAETGGSNPLIPTIKIKGLGIHLSPFFVHFHFEYRALNVTPPPTSPFYSFYKSHSTEKKTRFPRTRFWRCSLRRRRQPRLLDWSQSPEVIGPFA